MIKQEFTPAQQVALNRLESALAQCQHTGLTFIGMDSNLLAFDKDALLAAGWADDPHPAMRACDQGYTIVDFGTYRDSGGW